MPRAAPRPSAPTSPMKIRAGAAFHHKKPAHAPARDAESTARSSGFTMSYIRGLRNAQYAITVNAKNPNSAEPAARPSKPSVTFTALVVLHTMKAVQTIKIGPEISQPGLVARVNEIVSTTPVVLDNSHSNNNVMPKVIQPFFFQKIPRLCWRRTFK